VKSCGSLAVAVGNSLYFIGGVGNVQMWSYSLSQDAWKLLCSEQVSLVRKSIIFTLYIYVPCIAFIKSLLG
jgi:hypothetical protein